MSERASPRWPEHRCWRFFAWDPAAQAAPFDSTYTGSPVTFIAPVTGTYQILLRLQRAPPRSFPKVRHLLVYDVFSREEEKCG
jgi:hypothetical protein